MRKLTRVLGAPALVVALGAGLMATPLVTATPAEAAKTNCRNTGSFERWLSGFRRQAIEAGISRSTVRAALSDITLDPKVIKLDRRQRVFSQTFLKFAGRMIAKYRLQRGRKLIKKNARVFRRIEQRYGVPAPVLVAFWGLETDFGGNIGKGSTLRSLATLAYDCRRPELFSKELMSALKIIERGDLRPEEMIGPWAGEMGQTQFLASHYYNYGIDFDGDGRRDLLKSASDALASSANYLKAIGWRAGEPWLQEVTVPRNLDWAQSDLKIKHPRSKWAEMGVRARGGKRLTSDGLMASLILPMGRNGPAFLAYPNFDIYLEWNESLLYSTTAAYFATRLAGAGPIRHRDEDFDSLGYKDLRQLQFLLQKRGYDVGKVDGILGANTRAAVKDMQIKLSMPADSWPTPELLIRLGGSPQPRKQSRTQKKTRTSDER